MAVTSVTAIVTNFIVDSSTPANNNTFYVAFFGSDGSYSSSIVVNADITQTTQQVSSAIATAVANAVNTALGTSLTASNVILVNRPSDGTGLIMSGTIASGSLGNVQIASGGLTSGAIASGSIGNVHILPGGLFSGAIASGAIGNLQIASGGLTSGSIASGAIGNLQIASGGLTSGALASGAVGAAQIASGSLTTLDVASGGLLSGAIGSGQISTNHFASGAFVSLALLVADDDGVTAEPISGGRCVAYDASGKLIIAMAGIPSRMPAMGVVIDNALSGQPLRHYMWGEIDSPLFNLSGQLGEGAWVGTSGTIDTTQPTLSGNIHQMIGVIGDVNTICLGFRPTSGFITAELLASGQALTSGVIINSYLASGVINAISGNVTVSSGMLIVAGSGGFSGTLSAPKFDLGADLSLIPIVGNQSVVATWWGMQLKGNMQSPVDHVPSAIGANSAFSVAIPNQQAASIGLAIISASGQTGDLQQWLGSGALGAVFSAIDASGDFRGSLSSGDVEHRFVTTEAVSGVRCVRITASGLIQIAMAAVSGRMPADGIAMQNALSGQPIDFLRFGVTHGPAAQMGSGLCISGRAGSRVYVGASGQVVTISGGGPNVGTGFTNSGALGQMMGRTIGSGRLYVSVDDAIVSGAALITTNPIFWPL